MYEKRMKKMDGGYGTKRKKKGMGGRTMYNKGGEAMPKAKPC
jgi:hypothetical protein